METEYGESVLCGAGELDLDPDIVSEEAGKLYSELQTVVETHGAGVVESLVPILVWVLEGLASCRAQLRETEHEAEREKAEREALLDRYQAEKTLRRENQERYLELDDQMEQERRAMRGRDQERERRERELEKKAREQADQLVALEEQRAIQGRELNTLKHTHNKLTLSYRELLEKKSERESPLRNHSRSKSSEMMSSSEPSLIDTATAGTPKEEPISSPSEDSGVNVTEVIDIPAKPTTSPSFINDIISSTPELAQFHVLVDARASIPFDTKEVSSQDESGMEDEMREAVDAVEGEEEEEEERGEETTKHKVEEEERGEETTKHKVEEEERGEETTKDEERGEKTDKHNKEKQQQKDVDEDDNDNESMEWELRNTDSLFSELSELSRDYVESVDHGASVRGSADQFEEILSQYEELKHTHELVDAARKALISRVEELTSERSALQMEATSLQETGCRLEGRAKELEEEAKRHRKELEACQSEDPDTSLPTSMRRFSRSEMARVVMEKNQYKERLFELQEAVRRSQTLRSTKEERFIEEKRTTVWRKFNRLFGMSKEPLIPPPSGMSTPPPSLSHSSPLGSPRLRAVSQTTQAECGSPAALSPRFRRKEIYREIRSHVWGTLGKRQIHGWSMPLSHTQESSEPVPEPKDVPALMQLRLLDQRDSTAKLSCAVAVTPDISGEATCSVWVVSGPASSSDITVIDPARPNTVLDQFGLPPTSPALCMCAVPPTGDTSGTVWIGTQEGSVSVHSASTGRRRCLQSASFSEGVHSLTYSQGQVIAGLGDGTLAFFSHTAGGWDLQSHKVMPLGTTPLQPIRCCLAKAGRLWVGYWNRVHVVDIESQKVELTVAVSERSEQQVRFLCAGGSGVWVSCRLDPTLRLFDWATGRPLQQVDVTPLVIKTLGPAFLTLSPLQISSLTIISSRLWVGTGSGAIFSVPLSITSESVSIPYCSMASAQLCYHGHRQAVRFIMAAPDCLLTSGGGPVTTSQLILSGGEGYINFRIGDDASSDDPSTESSQAMPPQRSDRSHMIIWQSPSPAVPSPAL